MEGMIEKFASKECTEEVKERRRRRRAVLLPAMMRGNDELE
jgi:predicted nucleic acid-binding Zn ribbon protein